MKRKNINEREIEDRMKKLENLKNKANSLQGEKFGKSKKKESKTKTEDIEQTMEKAIEKGEEKLEEINKVLKPFEEGKRKPHQGMSRRDISELKEKRKKLKEKVNTLEKEKKII